MSMANNETIKPAIPLKPRPKPRTVPKPLSYHAEQSTSVPKECQRSPVAPLKPCPGISIQARPLSSPTAPSKPPRIFNYRQQTQSVNLEHILHGKDIITSYEEHKLLQKSNSAAENKNVGILAKNELSSVDYISKPAVPARPVKPLDKRPLPAIPRKITRTKNNEVAVEKTRHGLVIDELDLNELRDNLNKYQDFTTLKSNLDKMKSISSPSLFHRDEENEKETSKFRYSNGNLLSDIIFEDEDNFSDKIDGSAKQTEISKFHHRLKVVPGFKKGIKKWQSFTGRKLYTFNVSKSNEITRPRSDTAPIELHEFEKYADLHQDDDSALFDHVLVVSLKLDQEANLVPFISFRFPPKIDQDSISNGQDQIMNSIPQFCFPDLSFSEGYGFKNGENFSFVLTDQEGKRNYGFCKLIKVVSSKYPEVYCIISPHGLFSIYSQILEEVGKQRVISATAVFSFLKAVLSHSLPEPSSAVSVSFFTSGRENNIKEIVLKRPGDSAIHEHVDLSLLFTTLPIPLIIHLLTCMLIESKVILCSSSLSLLSSCCHGLISLMYPFTWEHTYIPVLPTNMVDVICVPTPYLIGILPTALIEMDDLPVEDATVVNLDDSTLLRKDPSKEVQFPKQLKGEVTHALEEIMYVCKSSQKFGDSEEKARNHFITEVFIRSYFQLMGHFESYYTTDENGECIVKGKEFYKACNTKEKKKFLKVFMTTQAFQEFVSNRKRNGPSHGLFENRFTEWKRLKSDERQSKSNFKDILSGFKKKLKL